MPTVVGGGQFPLKFALKVVTHPLSNTTSESVQLALIGRRPRAFQRATDEPCTLPISPPKSGTKCDFAVFTSKFNFCRKKSAASFFV